MWGDTVMTTEDVGSAGDHKTERADKGVQVTLRKPVKEMLETYKRSSGMSHPNILFDALEFSYEELPNLIKDRATRLDPDRKKLFARPSSPARHEDVETETFIVRMSQTNKDVIEDLWQQFEAPSRTALLAVAYEHYLNAMTEELTAASSAGEVSKPERSKTRNTAANDKK